MNEETPGYEAMTHDPSNKNVATETTNNANHVPGDAEINTAIAIYMEPDAIEVELLRHGIKFYYNDQCCYSTMTIPRKYTNSVDQCIPVVEKLGDNNTWIDTQLRYIDNDGLWRAEIDGYMTGTIAEVDNKSPSRALALAIFHCIKEREA